MEFLWSVFLRIRMEFENLLFESPYSVRMLENTEQENSDFGQFSRSVFQLKLQQTTRSTCIFVREGFIVFVFY